MMIWAILVYPLRRLGKSGIIAINMPVTILVALLGLSTFVVLLINTFVFSKSGFALYYASLVGGLTIIFIVFADAATRAD